MSKNKTKKQIIDISENTKKIPKPDKIIKDNYKKELDEYLKRNPDNRYLKYLDARKNRADLTSTICVQMVDYIDPEDVKTLLGARANAANPDRLHFAVCYQGNDTDKIIEMQKIPNVEIWHVNKEDANGSCSARYRCNLMIKDEDFIMHIDSHMMFAKFWDVALLEQWYSCKDPKAILTSYVTNSTPFLNEPIVSDKLLPVIREEKAISPRFFTDNTVKIVPYAIKQSVDAGTDEPQRGMYVSGHCLIAPAILDKTIQFDPDMFFLGDETSMAIRYWTNGWNIYHPRHIPVLHLYDRQAVNKSTERFNSTELNGPETERVEQLLRIKDNGIDLGRFDIGTERTLDDWQRLAGINFKDKTIKMFAHYGKFFTDKLTDDEKCDIDWRFQPVAENALRFYKQEKAFSQTINVIIYSWSDEGIYETIKRFRDTAKNPNRVYFSVLARKQPAFDIIKAMGKNISVYGVDPKTCTARGFVYNKLEGFILNENKDPSKTHMDNVLYVDTCTYPIKEWDVYLTESINDLGDNAVISNFCYAHTDDYDPNRPTPGFAAKATSINSETGRIIITPDPKDLLKKFRLTNTIVKHYIFAKTSILEDCRHDPDMFLDSDESQYILNLWTHGYDAYSAPILYFYYDAKMSNKNNENDPMADAMDKYYRGQSLNRLMLYEENMTVNNSNMKLHEHCPGTKRTITSFKHTLTEEEQTKN